MDERNDSIRCQESPNARTLRTYEAQAERYVERTSTELSPLVALLRKLIPSHSRVLELGSGPGGDALAFEAAGLVVLRTDATRAFVGRLQDQGHEARVVNALTDELGGPYDAVYANAVLLHFTPGELDLVLAKALKAVRPGGVIVASVKKGDGDAWSDRKLGSPRHFTYWREAPLQHALERAGWARADVVESTLPGAAERWITLTAVRPDPAAGDTV